MVKLRDYQKRAIAEIYQAIRDGKQRIMLQLQTGGGKTTIFSQIAKDFTSKRQQRVICVAHRVELIGQMSDRLRLMGVPNFAQYAGEEQRPSEQVHAVSIQTFGSKKYQQPENVGLIIVDESHHLQAKNTYGALLEAYPHAIVIGVTATPLRLDGKGFEDVFEKMVCGPSVKKLQAAGHLCKYRAFAGEIPDLRGIKTRAGDYQVRALEEACNTKILVGDLVEHYQRIASSKRCITFAVGVEHSKNIVNEHLAAGIPAEHIDGKTPKEDREAILNRFRTGETLVLSNCAIVTEGFDVPAAEVVQLARPTKSVGLYLQMVGRVLRPQDEKIALILDHGGLIEEHGLPCDDRNWTLKGVETKQTWTKRLDTGELVGDAERTRQELEHRKEVKLRELSEYSRAETLVLKLIATQQQRGYKQSWVYFRLIEKHANQLTLEHLKIYAKHAGYKRGWAQHKWKEFTESIAS